MPGRRYKYINDVLDLVPGDILTIQENKGGIKAGDRFEFIGHAEYNGRLIIVDHIKTGRERRLFITRFREGGKNGDLRVDAGDACVFD